EARQEEREARHRAARAFATALDATATARLLELRQSAATAAALLFADAAYRSADEVLPLRLGSLDNTGGPVPRAKVREVQRAWAKYLAVQAETVADLGGGVQLEMVLVPRGRFLMGATAEEIETVMRQYDRSPAKPSLAQELPQHQVKVM